MNCRFKLLVLVAVCAFLTSCTSVVNVEKFNGTQKGVRYSLPATYLLVSPKSDGTASYDWVYLPDPENEYAVTTWSFMSKYTTEITLENNFLKKVTEKSDSTGVGAKMFDAAQSVYSARTSAANETAKKEADKNTASQKAISDAKLELNLAQAELDVLKKNAALGANNTQILTAMVKVAQAQQKLDAATSASKSSLGAMNAPGGDDLKNGQAWGPVLFKVVQTKDDVKLIAVTIQQPFDTAVAVTSPTPVLKVTFRIEGPNILTVDHAKPFQFSLGADQTIESVDATALNLFKDDIPYLDSKVRLTLQPDKKKVIVDLSPPPSRGVYVMTVPYSTKPGEKPKVDTTVSFEVR